MHRMKVCILAVCTLNILTFTTCGILIYVTFNLKKQENNSPNVL